MNQTILSNNLLDIDRIIHEPGRLLIICFLYISDGMDFTFLMNQTGIPQSNLSGHLKKLEEANYVKIEKGFVGKIPHTYLSITKEGKLAYQKYSKEIKEYLL